MAGLSSSRSPARRAEDATVEWLLAGDPAVAFWTRWLLCHEPVSSLNRHRARISREGWGRRLLDARSDSGLWGGGFYLPKWTSTHYTLLMLRDLGVSPGTTACRDSARLLLDAGFLPPGGIAFWKARRSDDCVAAMVLALLVYFQVQDARVDRLIDGLLAAELVGGGWNCRRHIRARCASVHTTLSVLEALDELQRCGHGYRDSERAAASARGREALLVRHLYLSRKTRQPIDERVPRFVFPPRWRFDVLRCLYAFARANVRWDERMRTAYEWVATRRDDAGRWQATPEHLGKVHFTMERPRSAGRWNTLRARFVLEHYDAAARAGAR